MDPFVEIEFNGRKQRTKTIDKGGKRPVWDEAFDFQLETISGQIKLSCFDEDLISNDRVGDTTLDIPSVCTEEVLVGGRICQWIPIFYKGKKSGDLEIEVSYTPMKDDWSTTEEVPVLSTLQQALAAEVQWDVNIGSPRNQS